MPAAALKYSQNFNIKKGIVMFDFLKKKKAAAAVKPQVKVTFESNVMDAPPAYDPWDAAHGNADNEYANTIFLDLYTRPASYPQSPDEYARYVSYDLEIHDPIKKFKNMLADGYLEKADNIEILKTYKMPELKEILAANNLPTTGRRKSDLLDRITSSVDANDLDIPEKYTTSAKGAEYIDKHKDMLQLFRNPYYISYEEYAEAKATSKAYLKYNDIVWGIFNKRAMHIEIHDNAGRRSIALHRAMFLKDENKLADALYFYITVLYYDMNEYIIAEKRRTEIMAEINEKVDPSPFFVAPAIKKAIIELKEYYSEEMINKCYENYVHPATEIKQDDFKKMLLAIFDDKDIPLDKYLQ